MLTQKVLKTYGESIKLISTPPGFPIKYNERTGALEPSHSYHNNFMLVSSTSIGGVGAVLLLHTLIGVTTDSPSKCLQVFWALMFFLMAHSNWNLSANSRKLIGLFNGLVLVEKRMLKAGNSFHEDRKLRIALISCEYVSKPFLLMPILWGVGSMIVPCQSVNFYAFITPESLCNTGNVKLDNGIQTETTLWKYGWIGLVGIVNFVTFYASCTPILLQDIQILLGVMSLRRNIVLLKTLAASAIRKGKESRLIIFYRELQLLTGLYNAYHRHVFLHVTAALCFGNILLHYVTIRGLTSTSFTIPLFPLVVCLIIAVDTYWGILILFGWTAEPNTCSKRCLGMLARRKSLMLDKEMKRCMRSLPVLKIYIGAVNFTQSETSINLLNFCLERIVDLLLIDQGTG